MALMFPRLARNFARNGYYPTDEITLVAVAALVSSRWEAAGWWSCGRLR